MTQKEKATHQQIIDQAVLEDVAAEITIEAHPGIEDRPRKFSAFTSANAALIQPVLESLVQAYLKACTTTTTRAAAHHFMQHLLDAEA